MSQPPFFVVGAQRSGTTMLRLMLNNHPRLSIPFESGFIPVFYRRLDDFGDLRDPDHAQKLLLAIAEFPKVKRGQLVQDPAAILARPIASYADLIDAIFSEDARRKGKPRWGDKTPAYVTEIDVLCAIFPRCRIVHLVRDGRDVAVSLASLDWGSAHIPRVALDWLWKATLAHKMGALLGDRFLEVRYEDLVLDTEATARRVCEFLGEPFDRAMLTYAETAERELPAESLRWHRASIKAPTPEKVHGWKRALSHADRILFEQVAASGLELFGYELEHRRPTLRSRLKSLYYSTMRRW